MFFVHIQTKYSGIIIIRKRPMFVAFFGNRHPWIYIPTNRYTIISMIFIKNFPITLRMELQPH